VWCNLERTGGMLTQQSHKTIISRLRPAALTGSRIPTFSPSLPYFIHWSACWALPTVVRWLMQVRVQAGEENIPFVASDCSYPLKHSYHGVTQNSLRLPLLQNIAGQCLAKSTQAGRHYHQLEAHSYRLSNE
jgi:hypothetical protein